MSSGLQAIPIRSETGALPAHQRAQLRELIAPLKTRPGALLPILHAVQDAFGFVSDGAVALIADELNQSRAEIHGVLTFYPHFRRHAAGRHVLQLCRAEACQALGAVALATHVRERLAIDFHQTTADGAVTLEPAYCLGNCACGPSALLDGEIVGRLQTADLDDWLTRCAETPMTATTTEPSVATMATTMGTKTGATSWATTGTTATATSASSSVEAAR